MNDNVYMHGIVQILPGVPVPAEIYGLKAAGIATLFNLQAASPVPYLVPESWAISTESHGGTLLESDLRRAFENLTNGIKDNSVLMARSSATDESPGQNPTLFVHYDPSAIERSFSRFRDANKIAQLQAQNFGEPGKRIEPRGHIYEL